MPSWLLESIYLIGVLCNTQECFTDAKATSIRVVWNCAEPRETHHNPPVAQRSSHIWLKSHHDLDLKKLGLHANQMSYRGPFILYATINSFYLFLFFLLIRDWNGSIYNKPKQHIYYDSQQLPITACKYVISIRLVLNSSILHLHANSDYATCNRQWRLHLIMKKPSRQNS